MNLPLLLRTGGSGYSRPVPPLVHPLNVVADLPTGRSASTIHPLTRLSSFGADFLLRSTIGLDPTAFERRDGRVSRSGIGTEPVGGVAVRLPATEQRVFSDNDGDADSVSTLDLDDDERLLIVPYGDDVLTRAEYDNMVIFHLGADAGLARGISGAIVHDDVPDESDGWFTYNPHDVPSDGSESFDDGQWYDPQSRLRGVFGLLAGLDIQHAAAVLGSVASAAGYFQAVPVGVPGVVKALWWTKGVLLKVNGLLSATVLFKPLAMALSLVHTVAKGFIVVALKIHLAGCVKLACVAAVTGLGFVGVISALLLASYTFVLHFALWYGYVLVSNAAMWVARVILFAHACVVFVLHTAAVWYLVWLPYYAARGVVTVITLGKY